MQYTYQDIFFHCSKQFLNSLIWMPFSAFSGFCFTSSTLAKWFPLRTFSHWETHTKKVARGENGEGGVGGSCLFWQVRLWITRHEVTRWVERVFKKHSLKPNAASHNNSSYHTDTDGFLEHSPIEEACTTWPALQKIPEYFGSLWAHWVKTCLKFLLTPQMQSFCLLRMRTLLNNPNQIGKHLS